MLQSGLLSFKVSQSALNERLNGWPGLTLTLEQFLEMCDATAMTSVPYASSLELIIEPLYTGVQVEGEVVASSGGGSGGGKGACLDNGRGGCGVGFSLWTLAVTLVGVDEGGALLESGGEGEDATGFGEEGVGAGEGSGVGNGEMMRWVFWRVWLR